MFLITLTASRQGGLLEEDQAGNDQGGGRGGRGGPSQEKGRGWSER